MLGNSDSLRVEHVLDQGNYYSDVDEDDLGSDEDGRGRVYTTSRCCYPTHTRGAHSPARREVLKAQRSTDQLNGSNDATQPLCALTLISALADKHSRLLVPNFLALSEANMKGMLAPYSCPSPSSAT
ncbi:hypothetical protein AURDEDRAFT_163544 [Auricularia subglabra TFB-10046 SS5]|nr:hypothetical protein AURDEDRAFT_163544 [Auricularia subglabra TFB-10046 SS5]